ncbi:uncharacterized protein MONBRDRAFT_30963 [Monosiga brevicollis MX1]|uniref:Thioredoxin domain-containing protein n=1 Tax=Monosiga brevicollis TaxID=81824 RepID=A9UQF1_MONBE|nr:uncharacterized protein MONBRDRAFT_30963 [Monosiga brevicollis MX1]EDQ92587.1 predicted protein [Monosiga brevicollis MX1]|eukprot:XP_001742349.1 hypothetical protein [Monosiga brevicollis MX1]
MLGKLVILALVAYLPFFFFEGQGLLVTEVTSANANDVANSDKATVLMMYTNVCRFCKSAMPSYYHAAALAALRSKTYDMARVDMAAKHNKPLREFHKASPNGPGVPRWYMLHKGQVSEIKVPSRNAEDLLVAFDEHYAAKSELEVDFPVIAEMGVPFEFDDFWTQKKLRLKDLYKATKSNLKDISQQRRNVVGVSVVVGFLAGFVSYLL